VARCCLPVTFPTEKTMTQIRILEVFRYNGGLVFDDPEKGLDKEAFVAGIDDMLETLMTIKGITERFKLTFSPQPFPGYELSLQWQRPEFEGNWYYCPELETEGWLCPALYHYFETAPQALYVRVDPLA